MQRDKIALTEIYEISDVEPPVFPKYTTQLLNLANQNSQGTRPSVVGKVTELFKESDFESFNQWKEWYLERYPDAIGRAKKRIKGHVQKLREAIDKIDDQLIEKWVEDLVLVKTAEGLLIQNAVLEYLSMTFGKPHTPSTPEEESQGIDGHIGSIRVSVKPESYRSKTSTKHERFDAAMVYYKTTKKYLHIVYDESDFTQGDDSSRTSPSE